MDDMSRPVSGPPPGPGRTAPSAPCDAERRRSRPGGPYQSAGDTSDERTLIELRRKVQSGELLSTSTEKLLWKMRFNGHLTVVIQNGRVLKSGYEEGYFRRRNDLGGFVLET